MASVTFPNSAEGDELRRLNTLYELLSALTRAKNVGDVFKAATASLSAATEADRAAVLLFDSNAVMRFEAWSGLSQEYRQAMTGHSPWTSGTRDATPIVIPDVLAEQELLPYRDIFVRENIRSVVFVPLEGDRGVFGKFVLYYAEPHTCTQNELTVAQLIAGHVALAIERRRTETALAESERRLQVILDNSPAVVFLKDVKGRYVLINRRFEELFHLTKADALGKTDVDLFSPELAEEVRGSDIKVLELNQPLTVEEHIPQGDGIHTYLCVKFPIEDPVGGISGICGIATDITDRKRLDNASVHDAAIVENSDDAIVSKDLNGIVRSWNRGAERIFGYTAAEIIGKPVAILAAPEVINEMPGILEKIKRGERVDHYETRRRTKTGQIIHVSLTISPVRDASGRIIGASKIARDITGRKRIESELKRSNDELRRANQDLETFAYSASHDLQEPLRTVVISAQMLGRRYKDHLPPPASELLGTIISGAQRMERLIRDVLTYATATRYENAAPPLVDTNKVLASVLQDLDRLIRETGATVTADNFPVVSVHENRFAQLLQNLIGNALKYRAKQPPRIHISATERDGWWEFSVIDNGLGIDRSFAQHIFGLFKRLHSQDEYPGSGIGLAVCQRIVEQYGGRIWLEESTPGKGSTFCFTLPARHDSLLLTRPTLQ